MSKKSRTKKQQIRTIEFHLRNYEDYKVGIKNLQSKLDMILPNITTNYELAEGSTGTFTLHSSTEKTALDRIESRQAIETHELMDLYQMIVTTIDRGVEKLSQDEREFVKLRYFRRMEFADVCEKLGYSIRQGHRIRFNIMDRFQVSLANIKDIKI